MESLSEKLRNWRSRRGLIEGVDLFRILSNKTLEDIANARPKTKEELIGIKGFKDKKFAKYGVEILSVINDPAYVPTMEGKQSLFDMSHAEIPRGATSRVPEETPQERVFSVGDYLDLINVALGDFKGKVQGEVSSLDIRGNYLFFGLKDKEGASLINCFMWQSNYRLCGVEIAEGMEIIVGGQPEIYKASGRMTFRAETVELVGEGALKKAYDELKKKLDKEGLFAQERKRAIPEFPEKIGLITSKTGAVIHDFLNNIGKFGYKIKFIDSRVEGQQAVQDLLRSVRYFKDQDIDVLVIIRGGGSLESLQAFNNEILTREIANFPKPVIAGIGHDKDVPLLALTADMMASTPTAVTKILNSSWERALAKTQIYERDIFNHFRNKLVEKKDKIRWASDIIAGRFGLIFETFKKVDDGLRRAIEKIGYAIKHKNKWLDESMKLLQAFSPERQLKLGYSLVYSGKKLIRSVNEVAKGDEIDIKLHDGKIRADVKN